MRLPRLVIGAASSGAGKTSLTLGVLGALKDRGLDPRPFKIGPDYIDPGLHARVAGRPGRNLDPRLMGRGAVSACLARNGSGGVAVIEGVMGYYDGQPHSSADVAALVRAPAILALDASAAAESCAAIALGFVRYRRRSGIRAFVLNRVAGDAADFSRLARSPRTVGAGTDHSRSARRGVLVLLPGQPRRAGAAGLAAVGPRVPLRHRRRLSGARPVHG